MSKLITPPTLLLSVLGIATVPTFAIAQDTIQDRALQRAGCYVLQWEVPASTQRGLVAGTIPAIVWLTAAPIQMDSSRQDHPRFVMRPAPGHRQSEYEHEAWLLTPADTIVLMWDSGFHGVAARLGVVDAGDTDYLAGQARSWSDATNAGPMDFSTGVVAERVPCHG